MLWLAFQLTEVSNILSWGWSSLWHSIGTRMDFVSGWISRIPIESPSEPWIRDMDMHAREHCIWINRMTSEFPFELSKMDMDIASCMSFVSG